jgi:hypothetical protein
MSRLFFDIELPLRALSEGPTAAELARGLAERREGPWRDRCPSRRPAPRHLLAAGSTGFQKKSWIASWARNPKNQRSE